MNKFRVKFNLFRLHSVAWILSSNKCSDLMLAFWMSSWISPIYNVNVVIILFLYRRMVIFTCEINYNVHILFQSNISLEHSSVHWLMLPVASWISQNWTTESLMIYMHCYSAFSAFDKSPIPLHLDFYSFWLDFAINFQWENVHNIVSTFGNVMLHGPLVVLCITHAL